MMKKLIFIILVLGIGGYIGYFALLKEGHSRMRVGHNEKIELDQWIAFSPYKGEFSAFFPLHPTASKRKIPISQGNRSFVEYDEYRCSTSEREEYSISCIILPDSLLKWGSTLVLNGAFKLLLKNVDQKVKVVEKQSKIFKAFPSLDYEHHTQDAETSGMLVLVDKTLYKIEVTYPCHGRTKRRDEFYKFVGLFEPRKIVENKDFIAPF